MRFYAAENAVVVIVGLEFYEATWIVGNNATSLPRADTRYK